MKYVWLAIYFLVLIWSAMNPKDQFTWFLEVAPALIGFVILAFSYKKFPLTPLLYTLILIHTGYFDGWWTLYVRRSTTV